MNARELELRLNADFPSLCISVSSYFEDGYLEKTIVAYPAYKIANVCSNVAITGLEQYMDYQVYQDAVREYFLKGDVVPLPFDGLEGTL